MPRPDADSPNEVIVNVLRASDGWCKTHKKALKEVLAASDLSGHGALADTLEAAHTQYEKEKRDDVDLTVTRDALLVEVQKFLASLVATLRLNNTKQDKPLTAAALRALLRRFILGAPSRVRSLTAAQRAINRVAAALAAEPSALAQTTSKFATKAAAFQTQIVALQADYARESQERSQASATYDTLRAAGLKRIAGLQLAAEAILIDDEIAPLSALNAIFNVHNPAPRSSSTADELLESDSDLSDLSESDDNDDGTPPNNAAP